ncbi:MAG: ATP-binding protein, partial [Defluviitaleaceae bacterium]|nr:ATP-binding protein [Defluviitaleaceae bacterium]
MKITMENIGLTRYAELEMNDLTIICGQNNSGKTHIAYAIYGFFHFWNTSFQIPIDKEIIKKLKDTGYYKIQLSEFREKAPQIIERACFEYRDELHSVFSTHESKFENSVLRLSVSPEEIEITNKREITGRAQAASGKTGLKFVKKVGENELTFTLFAEDDDTVDVPDFIIMNVISNALKSCVFTSVCPNVFIASTERTGSAIFYKELDFARNRILDTIAKKDDDIDFMQLLITSKDDYARPVNHNVDFVRNLESISKQTGEICRKHSEILAAFEDMLGGNYQVTDKGGLFFVPKGNPRKKIQLSVNESSSSVRSLLHFGFYLKHLANVGDLLIIDEPELNLHPDNQRKMARLLANLVNCGMKIFITTHSDYILRELNNLILL